MTTENSVWNAYVLPIIIKTVIYTFTTIYSTLFLLTLLYNAIRKGYADIFKVKTRELPPKCLNDPVYGEHHYVQIKNIRLHYVEAGDKEKPLIVFVHGFPDFWYSWRHQIKEFSKDFRTIAIDLRGYGDSEKPGGKTQYGVHHIVEDVKNLLDTLEVEKCILIGHDWGGVAAWSFAQKYPEKLIKYVVLNAPEQSIFWKYIMSSFDQFKRSWYIFFFQAPCLPEMAIRMKDLKVFEKMCISKDGVSFATEEDVEAYKFTFGKPGALTPPINYYRAIKLDSSGRTRRTDRGPITIPGLMIISDNDVALSKELLQMSAKKIGGENMKTVMVNNAGHFVQHEKSAEVNKAISDFIRNV
ncbi:hypothetical protein O3M35_010753 [Rhynocoris fuscipes]|uniref:AB hydrolase-1 domain-containing protein n=1 Tax=Rhynocoris fuscipes TaxID=488301 RepID=A0AAW1D072_9HEMI